jgi:hypothetical protein
MLSDNRIVLPELQPFLAVVPVLLSEITVIAGFALELDNRASFLPLGHDNNLIVCQPAAMNGRMDLNNYIFQGDEGKPPSSKGSTSIALSLGLTLFSELWV